MSNGERLHPAAILFNFIKVIKEALFAIILGFITFRDESFFYFILISSVLVILLIIYSVASWYRYTYRIEADELRVEYGIFIRKKRFISINRIQSIDLTAGVIHRIFNLVKVKIETAGSGMSSEASLTAVKLAEGERLRNELKKERTPLNDVEEQLVDEEPSYKISFKRLFLAGSTSGSIGIILALFAFVFSELEQFIPNRFYDNTVEWIIGLSLFFIIGLSIVVLILLWLFGIAGTMIKYGNFTITRNKDELFITRGLLEKKQLTIPLRRIQAVGIQESLIRQPLGYVTVFAEVAGGSMDKGEEFSTVLFPIMKADEVEDFLQELLPDYAKQPEELNPLPKRALKFYLLRATLPITLMFAAVLYFLPPFIWIPIVFFIGALFLGFLRFKDAGYDVEGKRLLLSYRTVSKMTMIIYHKRIQAFEKKQHKIQKAQELATMKLSIIAGLGGKHYTVKDMEERDVDLLSDWYSYRK
ncbi:hypothetical protein CIL05_06285 [Virgibacillus profundi]|uniref:YdbS-like PH domain-containing protein n=2 Tax=Virgibacillus profundi TaxID=2024555 RepID=A0A2A2IHB5_9BACI|nr:hypothetical protein CIL05_06285 [Virgibacillus profundi]PXY54878.1 hypothetical protein CIT14_06370 [Virgibacillus profundi]